MRFALVPLAAAIVLAGIWITGGVITDDFRTAMLLTALWFALAGLVSLAIGWRRRRLALPVFGTYVVTALAAGGYLAYASMVDRVVDETVAVAAADAAQTPSGLETTAPPRNVALARGVFTSGEHTTSGKATVIRLSNGRTVLTLTEFATSPGPDLRVYLGTGTSDDLRDVTDLGGLKGNKGNQQYDVPPGTDIGSHRTVVVWCRAFSVPFGSATLS
jgi:Electron transfer DM13